MATISQSPKFPDFKSPNPSERELTTLLYNLTGHVYVFATSSSMRWGKDGEIEKMGEANPNGFYQLMPDTLDDGFFDWYCDERSEQQFFPSIEPATLQFIHYWMKWNALGKPNPFKNLADE
jgi:hypothetical protein